MTLFYKIRPMLRSAQVEKELAALKEEFRKLKEAFDRCIQPVDPIDLTTHTFTFGFGSESKVQRSASYV